MERGKSEHERAVRLKGAAAQQATSLQHDRLLLGAVAAFALLLGFQLVATLRHPPWLGPVTDWLLTALAWLELAVVLYVSLRLGRARWPGTPTRALLSAALLCYAVARTLWTVDDQLLVHQDLPFPSLPDYLFVLQYPLFFLGVLLIPRTPLAGSRLLTLLDCLLFLGAAAALSWTFLLAPIFDYSRLSPLARGVSLSYPLGDLLVLVGLALVFLRPHHYRSDRLVLGLLIAAFACLVVGDLLAVALVLHPQHVFRRGALPDLFWMAASLLLPLAVWVGLRRALRRPRTPQAPVTPALRMGYRRDDVLASLRLVLPVAAAVLASVAILLHAELTEARSGIGVLHWLGPFAISFGLLLLAILRQELTFLENARLQREREEARAYEQALRALNRRKDEFLSVVSHELRTPLASLRGYLELLARRFDAWWPQTGAATERARPVASARAALAGAEESVCRLSRLGDDLLDDARVSAGRLALRPQPCDLGAIVRAAVEEQRALVPQRSIHLAAPVTQTVPVLADAERIAQVVTNYLTNALKYSKEDQPVAVRLDVVEGGGESDGGEGELGALARVSVRDEGIGIPVAEQQQVWERFAVVAGTTVQSGSGISLGLGLHICKSIIEAHHGHVGLDSAPGQGATFWFTLPLALPSAAPPGTG